MASTPIRTAGLVASGGRAEHKTAMPSIKSLVPLCFFPPLLCGCVLSGGGMEEMVDRSIVTGSVSSGGASLAPDQLSDQRTVRNAVSAADLDVARSEALAWANADTGASGVITTIREERQGDRICRSFQTSRQRFDGIALYDGQACTRGRGEWTLTRFRENG